MSVSMRDGSVVEDPRLGRLKEYDDRSKKFNIAPLLEEAPVRAPHTRYWHVPYTLDQGQTSACVGFSWTHEAMAQPVMVPRLSNEDGLDVYHEAQKVDEWEGEEPAYEGTSVLAGAKVMQSRGHFLEYRWAYTIDDLLLSLSYHGPAVLGIEWHNNMYDPDDEFYLNIGGEVVGGHAILAYGVVVDVQTGPEYVLLHNSWGPMWGRYGNVKVRIADMERLLLEGGEACVPVGRRYP